MKELGKIEVFFIIMGVVSFIAMICSLFAQYWHLVLLEGVLVLNAWYFLLFNRWINDLENDGKGNYMSIHEIRLWRIFAIIFAFIGAYRMVEHTTIFTIKYLIFDFFAILNAGLLFVTMGMIRDLKKEQDEMEKEMVEINHQKEDI